MKTTSVALAPICNPKLPEPRVKKEGAPQGPFPCLRHTSTPRPYEPPTKNAPFNSVLKMPGEWRDAFDLVFEAYTLQVLLGESGPRPRG